MSTQFNRLAAIILLTVTVLLAGACGSDAEPARTPTAIPAAQSPVAQSPPAVQPSSGLAVGGGLSIPEAMATDATGILAVRGHLFGGGEGLRFCEDLVGLGERYGCDGQSIPITGLDASQIPEIVFFEGTSYTEVEITLFGELIDDTFVVDQLATG